VRTTASLIIALSGLLVALLVLGTWSWQQKVKMDLEDVFSSGVFSPIRAKYPSFVTREQEAEIRRLEAELHLRLEAEARTWKILSLSSYIASALPLLVLLLVAKRAWKRRRELKE